MNEDETKEAMAHRKRASLKEGIGKIIGDSNISKAGRAEKVALESPKRKRVRKAPKGS